MPTKKNLAPLTQAGGNSQYFEKSWDENIPRLSRIISGLPSVTYTWVGLTSAGYKRTERVELLNLKSRQFTGEPCEITSCVFLSLSKGCDPSSAASASASAVTLGPDSNRSSPPSLRGSNVTHVRATVGRAAKFRCTGEGVKGGGAKKMVSVLFRNDFVDFSC